jgi:hypothetical protein
MRSSSLASIGTIRQSAPERPQVRDPKDLGGRTKLVGDLADEFNTWRRVE